MRSCIVSEYPSMKWNTRVQGVGRINKLKQNFWAPCFVYRDFCLACKNEAGLTFYWSSIFKGISCHFNIICDNNEITWLVRGCWIWSEYAKADTCWSLMLGWRRSLYWCEWGICAAIWRPAAWNENDGASRTDEGLHAEVSPPANTRKVQTVLTAWHTCHQTDHSHLN